MTTDWLDRVAGDLLETEHEVRTALRAIAYGRPDPHVHRSTPGRITLMPNQARALLRGVMPATIAVTSRRKQHARLMAALTLFARQSIALNDTNPYATEAPIAAAVDLIDDLREMGAPGPVGAGNPHRPRLLASPPVAHNAAYAAVDGRTARERPGLGRGNPQLTLRPAPPRPTARRRPGRATEPGPHPTHRTARPPPAPLPLHQAA